MAEFWGYCATCERWFYPEPERPDRPPTCPVCSAQASTVEERPSDVV
ncbi:MAG: hypothetical protein H0W51_08305 [Euzebyales bacterium]|nr:hypothetical protein [Euzebyales bacterium]